MFTAVLTIGLPIAVLPEFVHQALGFSAFIVGVVIGIQSLATVATRHRAGSRADRKGGKPTVQAGLWYCSAAGLIYWVSALRLGPPGVDVAILVIGRLILGFGESLLITGALTWGIGLVGSANAGKVMAWNGIAMYGALSFGAPLGLLIAKSLHFSGLALAVSLCPLISQILVRFVPAVDGTNALAESTPFLKIIRQVWAYGAGMALGTMGFGALSTFIGLYLHAKGWGNPGTALVCFGVAYVAVRLVAGHLPDRTGGKTVALVSLAVEAVGQIVLWRANGPSVAYLGAAITGLGFSLVFPAFGVQASKHVPAHSKGSALGAFFAFFDIALGVSGPVCGAVGSLFGFPSVYFMGALACLGGVAIAFVLAARTEPAAQRQFGRVLSAS